MERSYLFTSESVTEGHPDKVCDQISDAILDEILTLDREGRVACETLITKGLIVVAGEFSIKQEKKKQLNIPHIVKNVIKDIGYTDKKTDFHYDSTLTLKINGQSADISMGVDSIRDRDQGMMFGYATDETPEFMPLPITLAHKLAKELATIRKKNLLNYLRPDGKSQVTVLYENGKPQKVTSIVLSTQHTPEISQEKLREDLCYYVVNQIIPKHLQSNDMKIFINPTGQFIQGGPCADTGLTGRKIIVDTYGGVGSHGGGAFSGKDPSKVDRSASYMARYLAKNIVASGVSKKCSLQLAYIIGKEEPVSVMVDTMNTNKISEDAIVGAIKKNFALSPNGIIEKLDLKKPKYRKTAIYGHFGRNGDTDFTWEKTDSTEVFRNLLSH